MRNYVVLHQELFRKVQDVIDYGQIPWSLKENNSEGKDKNPWAKVRGPQTKAKSL